MIVLTRLDGTRCAINDEIIERIDETPTSVVRLLNGNSYPVLESLDEIIDLIASFRARAHAQVVLEGRSPSFPPVRRMSVVAAVEED